MEDTLREINKDILDRFNVLILVLMEDTLRGKYTTKRRHKSKSLNPCSNGRYSQRQTSLGTKKASIYVLILVLMEDTLRGSEEVDTDGNPQLS